MGFLLWMFGIVAGAGVLIKLNSKKAPLVFRSAGLRLGRVVSYVNSNRGRLSDLQKEYATAIKPVLAVRDTMKEVAGIGRDFGTAVNTGLDNDALARANVARVQRITTRAQGEEGAFGDNGLHMHAGTGQGQAAVVHRVTPRSGELTEESFASAHARALRGEPVGPLELPIPDPLLGVFEEASEKSLRVPAHVLSGSDIVEQVLAEGVLLRRVLPQGAALLQRGTDGVLRPWLLPVPEHHGAAAAPHGDDEAHTGGAGPPDGAGTGALAFVASEQATSAASLTTSPALPPASALEVAHADTPPAGTITAPPTPPHADAAAPATAAAHGRRKPFNPLENLQRAAAKAVVLAEESKRELESAVDIAAVQVKDAARSVHDAVRERAGVGGGAGDGQAAPLEHVEAKPGAGIFDMEQLRQSLTLSPQQRAELMEQMKREPVLMHSLRLGVSVEEATEMLQTQQEHMWHLAEAEDSDFEIVEDAVDSSLPLEAARTVLRSFDSFPTSVQHAALMHPEVERLAHEEFTRALCDPKLYEGNIRLLRALLPKARAMQLSSEEVIKFGGAAVARLLLLATQDDVTAVEAAEANELRSLLQRNMMDHPLLPFEDPPRLLERTRKRLRFRLLRRYARLRRTPLAKRVGRVVSKASAAALLLRTYALGPPELVTRATDWRHTEAQHAAFVGDERFDSTFDMADRLVAGWQRSLLHIHAEVLGLYVPLARILGPLPEDAIMAERLAQEKAQREARAKRLKLLEAAAVHTPMVVSRPDTELEGSLEGAEQTEEERDVTFVGGVRLRCMSEMVLWTRGLDTAADVEGTSAIARERVYRATLYAKTLSEEECAHLLRQRPDPVYTGVLSNAWVEAKVRQWVWGSGVAER